MSEPRGPRRPRPPFGSGRLSPDQPVWDVVAGRRGAEEGEASPWDRPLVRERPGTSVERLPAGEQLPAGPADPRRERGGARLASPSPRARRGRQLLAIVLALGLFGGGIALGSTLAAGSRRPAATAPTPAVTTPPSTAPATTLAPRVVTPPACLSAVDDADAAVSYLVAGQRGKRLATALQQFRAAAAACRRAS
jgi:hypothetical protein